MNSKTTDRIESRQLAPQIDDEDDYDRLPVASLLEELVDGRPRLAADRLLFHLLQFRERLVRVASQSQQCCGVKNRNLFRIKVIQRIR